MRGDIVAACMIVAVGAFMFAVMLGFLDGSEQIDKEMNYEDWTDYDTTRILGMNGSSVEAADGRLHAVGLGTTEIVNSDGSTYRIRVNPAHATLILIDGQSNAAYWSQNGQPAPSAAEKDVTPVPELGTCFYVGRASSMPYHEAEDVSDCRIYDFVNASTGKVRVGDKGPELCKTYYEQTGKKVVWVCLGIPSKRIAAWDQPNGSAWTQNIKLMDQTNALLESSGFRIDKTIVFWSQGESDYLHSTGYDHYISSFRTLHDSAPAAWGHDIDAWYLMQGRTAKVGWVNDAFAELAQTMDGVYLATTAALVDSFTVNNGLLQTDELHYSQKGDNALANAGARYATEAQGLAPIYLVQSTMTAEVESEAEAPALGQYYRTDESIGWTACEWSEAPDTSAEGTYVITGTASAVSPWMLEFAPTVLIVEVVEPDEVTP